MAKLRLAGNQIYQGVPTPFGHLQVVYADDGSQHEIEVLPENRDWTAFSGNWSYPRESNTPEKNFPGAYASADLPLGNRSPGDVWDILKQVHGQFAEHGLDIPYRPFSNSNSYANTVLSVVGIDTSKILEDATPPALKLAEFVGRAARPVEGEVYKHLVGLFPGVNYNVLQDEDHAISLDITGTDRGDIVRTGIRDDSIKGESGNDKLFGGGGGDIIDGGGHKDVIDGGPGDDGLSGGPGRDTFVVSEGSDVILDFEPGKDKFRFSEDTAKATAAYDEAGRATTITHSLGEITLYKTNLGPVKEKYPELTWTPNAPVITGYETFQEDDLIFLKLNYLDADGDAEGFGFRV